MFGYLEAVVFNESSMVILKRYSTLGVARGALARMKNSEGLKAMWDAEYQKLNVEVEVINCLSGKPVMIKKSQRGGCCDPSMELYHSM